ncbi:MAG: hypothetical protein VX938_08480, partial [Myxococcota bacterium]|nr:hypothetical protein [Myxococcota bacterium]
MSTFVPTRWMIQGGALVGLALLLAACGDITVAPDPVVCEPVCEDRTCGDDGCGGVCGTCEDDQACAEGQCANLICTPEMGGCDGELNLVTCDATGTAFDADVPAEDCSASFEGQGRCEQTDADEDGVPEDATCVCGPVCDGISCGDDGCGGSCGTCSETETCQDGGCVALICTPGQPYCDEAQLFTCNGDGTGFDAAGTATDCSQEHGGQGICVAEDWDENGVPETAACQCAPACDDFNCGDDGCGSVCGECAETDACDGGTCTPVICTPGESYCVDGTLSTCNALGTGPATDGTTEACAPLFAGQGACLDEDADQNGVVDTAACVCVPACDDKGCWEDSGCQLDDGSAIHCDQILCDTEAG